MLLLFVIASARVPSALERREAQRQPVTNGSLSEGSFAFASVVDEFRSRPLTRVLVDARHGAPTPPGLSHLPRSGEYVVSPALLALLNQEKEHPDLLQQRFEGRRTGSINSAGLLYPAELLAYVGVPVSSLGPRDGVAWGSAPAGFGLPRVTLTLLPIGIAAVVLPVLVFLGTVTRLSASNRDRRLAALRLIGLYKADIQRIAVAEAALLGSAGAVLGLLLFLTARPTLSGWGVAGYRWWPSDMSLPAAPLMLILISVPALATLATLLALRPVQVDPLGVTRRSRVGRLSPLRLLPLIVGLGVLVYTNDRTVWGGTHSTTLVLLLVGFCLTLLGIALGAPMIGSVIASLLLISDRSLPCTLAARRYKADPTGTARVTAGVLVAVFIVGSALALIADTKASASIQARAIATGLRPGVAFIEATGGNANDLASALRGHPGVNEVLDIKTVDIRPTHATDPTVRALVASCQTVSKILSNPFRGCSSGATYVAPGSPSIRKGQVIRVEAQREGVGKPDSLRIRIPASVFKTTPLDGLSEFGIGVIIPPEAVNAAELASIPSATALAVTDGSGLALERLRTDVATVGAAAAVHSRTQLISSAEGSASRVAALLTAFAVFNLLVGAISLAISIADSISQRRRGLAALWAAGVGRQTILASFVLEIGFPLALGLLISASGALLAGEIFLKLSGQTHDLPLRAVSLLVGAAMIGTMIAVASAGPLLHRSMGVSALRE